MLFLFKEDFIRYKSTVSHVRSKKRSFVYSTLSVIGIGGLSITLYTNYYLKTIDKRSGFF
jgi:hypothetical protein